MTELRGRPFPNRQRWGLAVGYAILAVIGSAVTWRIATLSDPLFLVPVAWYTAFASVVGLTLSVAHVLTRRLPSSGSGTAAGEAATILRAWPWGWRFDVAIDAGLVLLSTVYMVMALRSEEALPIAPLALLILLIWFGGNTILVLTGRRRLDALSLTKDHLIRDSINGRERIHRNQVVDAKVRAGWVFVEFSGDVERHTGPRPWRRDALLRPWRRDRHLNSKYLMIDPELMGPEPEQIVTWLRHELDLDQPTRNHDHAPSTWRKFLPWRKTL